MTVKFIEGTPPRPRLWGKASLDPVRKALIENPGVWAEVVRRPGARTPDVRGTPMALINTNAAKFPGFRFESVSRQEGDDAVVYARAVKS